MSVPRCMAARGRQERHAGVQRRRGLILGIAILIAASLGFPAAPAPPAIAADGAVSKIGSFLDLRVKAKAALAKLPAESRSRAARSDGGKAPLSDLAVPERVFIHLAARPTAAQQSELKAIGVTLYPDSWMPRTDDPAAGFLLADMPVARLADLAAKSYVRRLESAERTFAPQNDLGRGSMNVDPVWGGGYTGSGVTIAVIDSGLDLTHPDIPTPAAAVNYANYPQLDGNVANPVSGHGTHVTASALGRGMRNPAYKGVAPDASLVFLRVGNDTDATATSAAMVAAIKAAVDIYHARIISMSYGGASVHHDGSDEVSLAADYATSKGATVFAAAGEDVADWHVMTGAAASSWSQPIRIDAYVATTLNLGLVWYDGAARNNLRLSYFNSSMVELTDVITGNQSESLRGTEAV